MWSDLTLVVDFFFSLMSGIASLVVNSILIITLGLFVLGLVVKVLKRVLR